MEVQPRWRGSEGGGAVKVEQIRLSLDVQQQCRRCSRWRCSD